MVRLRLVAKMNKKLEEQLNCSICLDTYTDPKLLQCSHVFCQQCLVPLVREDQLSLSCPTCRKVTPIPDKGVEGLDPAFHINNLLEIYNDSVKKRDNPEATPEGAVGGTKADTPSKKARCCTEHTEEELKVYCETCGELVCLQCVIQGGKHHDHDYALLKVAFEKYKKEITPFLEPMKEQVTVIKKALEQFKASNEEISNKRASIEDKIHATFRQFREVLTVRETELIGQLHQITQAKLKGLAAQSDQIETTLTQLNNSLRFMEKSLRTGNESVDVLMMKANTVQQVKELTTPFQQDMLKPNTGDDMIFSALADMTAICKKFVFTTGEILPECYITYGIAATVGKKSTVTLEALAMEGVPYEKAIESRLKCNLVSDITRNHTSVSIEKVGHSQYKMSYKPNIKGTHKLHIEVEGQSISRSPFTIAVKSSVMKLGTRIATIDEMETPCGVAISQNGEMLITERCCVSVFSPSGKKLRSFGEFGSGQGEFQQPHGIAVDGEGNILVADLKNHRIQKFTAEGKFLAAVGSIGGGHLQFNEPVDIAIHAQKIYVSDSGNQRIQVLNSDLTFSSIFKKRIGSPFGVACDSTGNVYVTDTKNRCVQIFTVEGSFSASFGLNKVLPSEPFGIAVDADDMVYVSDKNHIFVFTSENKCVKSFESKGAVQLAVDSNGVLYVCDKFSKAVDVF